MINFLCSRFFLGFVIGIPICVVIFLLKFGSNSNYPNLWHFSISVFFGSIVIGFIFSHYRLIKIASIDIDLGLFFLIPLIALIVLFLMLYLIDNVF